LRKPSDGHVSHGYPSFQTLKGPTSMNYLLCIDVGNSLCKVAVFNKNRLVLSNSLPDLDLRLLKALFSRFPIQDTILCQVKSIKNSIKNYLKKHSIYTEMSLTLRLPVKIKYLTPDTLGKDRLAAVCGAVRLHSGSDLLVIGIGTCITYDLVTSKHHFIGGSISPGLDMRLKSMHYFTARLPEVQKNMRVSLTGKNTVSALQAGALWGIQAEISGMIKLYQAQYPNVKVILFGGGAEFYKNRLKKAIFAHPNLVILGLKEILSINVQTI
jgi:type III pantothenate kinase